MLNLDFKTLIYSYNELFVLFTSKGNKIGDRGCGDGRQILNCYYDISLGATQPNEFLFGRA
jgi:hypothetical protein